MANHENVYIIIFFCFNSVFIVAFNSYNVSTHYLRSAAICFLSEQFSSYKSLKTRYEITDSWLLVLTTSKKKKKMKVKYRHVLA